MSNLQETCVQPSHSRWLTEEVFNLIDLVRSDEAIYNPRHKYYFCRPYVENFWREIDFRLNKSSGASLSKWTNLRISFRREYASFQDEKVTPSWTYFDRMLFLYPYLRNKKPSDPKVIESHLQEAIAQISGINYKQPSESHVNEYMDQYLSYCEDDPQMSPPLDDILENDNQANPIDDVKPEYENELEESNYTRENDEYKDIIIEISDETTQPQTPQNVINQLSPESDAPGKSLLKRSRIDRTAIANSITATASTNISLVRPLALVSHPAEVNLVNNSVNTSSHSTNNSNRESPISRRNNLCECKTDSDAMFLMSMLPDIRKLNGRDRGKIKIAFQNILQEFLYPE